MSPSDSKEKKQSNLTKLRETHNSFEKIKMKVDVSRFGS